MRALAVFCAQVIVLVVFVLVVVFLAAWFIDTMDAWLRPILTAPPVRYR